MMDFGNSVWDVSSEAHHLTQTLFGNGAQKSKKATKRKIDDLLVKSDGVKKPRPDSVAQKQGIHNNIKPTENATPAGTVQELKKKRKRKRKQHKNEDSSVNTDIDNTNNISGINEKGSKVKFTEKKGQQMNVESVAAKALNLKRKKGKGHKEEGIKGEAHEETESQSVSDEDITKRQGPLTNGQPEKKKKKRKNKKSNGVIDIAGDEYKAAVGVIKNNKTQEVVTESSKSQSNQERNESPRKKKRKRKCKKNKFKDYSKEEETTQEQKAESNASGQSNNIELKGSEAVDPEKHPEKQTSAKKKKKKQKQAGQSSINEDTSCTFNSKSASLSKNIFDHAKLSALLDESKQEMNKDKSESAGKEKNKQNKMNDTSSIPKPLTLLEKSKERLKAARFRYINEQLYTTTGDEALEMFREDQNAFHVYHEGFQSQVEKWPINPIDVIIDNIKTRPKHLVVADFGCGDAKLARSVANKVHSFDLVALNEKVTVCDMSKVPLKDCSVDMAVFCLSLMGTNLTSYLGEANRVLKQGGTMKVAEVTSRFNSLGAFIVKVEKMGFKVTNQDSGNRMFVMMDFRKTSNLKGPPKLDIQLSPCVYKKR